MGERTCCQHSVRRKKIQVVAEQWRHHSNRPAERWEFLSFITTPRRLLRPRQHIRPSPHPHRSDKHTHINFCSFCRVFTFSPVCCISFYYICCLYQCGHSMLMLSLSFVKSSHIFSVIFCMLVENSVFSCQISWSYFQLHALSVACSSLKFLKVRY